MAAAIMAFVLDVLIPADRRPDIVHGAPVEGLVQLHDR